MHNRSLTLLFLCTCFLWTTNTAQAQSLADKPYPEGMESHSGTGSAIQVPATDEKTEEGKAGEPVPGVMAPTPGLKELYYFSGLTDDGYQGEAGRKEATSIHCSNIGTTTAQIEIELFQWSGASIYTGSVSASPGGSYTFSTQNTTIYFDDFIFKNEGENGTVAIFQGHGRIYSNSGNIICTAQALDPLGYPPQFITNLQLFRLPKALKPSGLPLRSGNKTVRYYFSGLTDDGKQGAADRKEATSIHCSNIGTTTAQIDVELFQWSGASIYTGSVTASAGASYTFSTQNTTIYFDDFIFKNEGENGTVAIFQGHGRIYSDSGNIICTAQVIDPLNYPPIYVSQLPLYDEYGYPAGGSRERAVFFPIVRK